MRGLAAQPGPGPALRSSSGPMSPMSRRVTLERSDRSQSAGALRLPSGALTMEQRNSGPVSPISMAGQTPAAACVASMQQMAFSSEEATMGRWRRNVAELRVLFEEKHVEEDTVRNNDFTQVNPSSVSFMLPVSSGEEEHDLPCRGIRGWSPATYGWITGRMSTSTKHVLVLGFMVLEGIRLGLAKDAFQPGVNVLAVLVAENLCSFVLSAVVTFAMEGCVDILSWNQLWRFVISALLFTLASGLVLTAYMVDTSAAEVVTFGYSYMPISAVLSYYAFNRRYGRLEWLSVGIITLGVFAFVLLREECREGKVLQFQMKGFLLVLASVFFSATGSILAEQVFKDRTLGPVQNDRFYVMKFHLDLTATAVAAVLWVLPLNHTALITDFMLRWEQSKSWFGIWNLHTYFMVAVMVAHGWAAGLITREYSTVIRSLVQTLALLSSLLIGDPLRDNRLHFTGRAIPSWLLYLIVLLAALIFQTGRVNLKVIRKACDLGTEANPGLHLISIAKAEADPITPHEKRFRRKEDKSDRQPLKGNSRAKLQAEEEAVCCPSNASGVMKLLLTYALMICYVVMDGGRTLILQKALSTTATNSTVMGLVCYVVGVIVALSLTAYYDGWEGIRRAWSPEKILQCLPAAFLFALATTLGNLGFAMGISPALYLVLGKFYTPVAAFFARWILQKYYMPLEWFSLIILTFSSAAFGYLQAYQVGHSFNASAPVPAMMMVLGSAAVSALASLVTEKILKGENEPFHIQKVRLDVGSVLSSLVLIPLIGLIATRPQDIPWLERPESYSTCPASSVCWDKSAGCGNDQCTCACTSGLFAGWDTWLIFMAVFVNTAQGWLVGKVTHTFSVVHRAIADSFSLLGIYFIGDPLFNGKSLADTSLNLVAMIVPLSTATFSVATAEMRKAFEAQKKMTMGHRQRVTSLDFDSDDESVMLGNAVHNLSMSIANSQSDPIANTDP